MANQPDKENFKLTAEFIEKHTWAIGLIAALTYGVGWFVQYVVSFRLGVGPIYPSKESSLATGLTFLFFVLPLIVEKFSDKKYSYAPNWKIDALIVFKQIFFYVGYLFAVCSFTMQGSSYSGNYWVLMKAVFFLTLIGFCVVFWSEILIKSRDGFAIFQIVSLISTYTFFVAPYLQPVFGGYALSRVEVKTDAEETSGFRLLVTSDADFITLAQADNAKDFWISFVKGEENAPIVTRVSTSEIKFIKSVPKKLEN